MHETAIQRKKNKKSTTKDKLVIVKIKIVHLFK